MSTRPTAEGSCILRPSVEKFSKINRVSPAPSQAFALLSSKPCINKLMRLLWASFSTCVFAFFFALNQQPSSLSRAEIFCSNLLTWCSLAHSFTSLSKSSAVVLILPVYFLHDQT